jgi:hypothetical protein
VSAVYPSVTGERETLDRVLDGASIARYGDGEFKMASHGASIKSQRGHPELTRRLRAILEDSGACLVGIPNIRSATPKVEFWGKYMRYADLLADRPYVSSFITRPDSAPWIDTPEYWATVESLWRGRDVTLVRGSTKSLVAEDLASARTVTEIVAPRQHAWAEYASLLERIGTPERVLLCLGPTATVMAVDLCAKGVQAIDLGHLGLFRRKHLRGEPMWLSKEDKSHDQVTA